MSERDESAENHESWKVNEDAAVHDLCERTMDFARRVIRLYRALPKSTEAQILGKQFLRSGTSVGANYREAYRARSRAEFIAKMGDSLRELDETAYWLDLIAGEQMLPPPRLAPLRGETEQLLSIFVASLNRLKRPQ